MAAIARAERRHRPWLLDQHGAWAMLAVPLLLGVAASRPVAPQLLLALAAVAGYLALATSQAYVRTRGRASVVPSLVPSLLAYATAGIAAGLPLMLVDRTLLALVPILAIAAGASLFLASRPRGRPLVARLIDAAPATLLTPAAASLAGTAVGQAVVAATIIAAIYLVGTVLVVRSAIRERGNTRFAGVAVAWHVLATGAAVLLLPTAYAVVGAVLTGRSFAVPILERRLARSGRRLRPVQLGLIELGAAALLVAVSFAVRP